MTRSKPQFLTLIGNIGSGKSSAAKAISSAFELPFVDADSLFQTTDPFAKAYLDDIPRWAFTNELWLTMNRAKLINRLAHPEKLTVVDSGLLMSWVFGYSHRLAKRITPEEWEFFSELYDHFTQDFWSKTLVLRIKCSQKTQFERIKKRGRAFELEYYTAEYLDQLEKSLEKLEKKLGQTGIPLLTIDEETIPDFIDSKDGEQKLIKKAKQFLKKHGVLK